MLVEDVQAIVVLVRNCFSDYAQEKAMIFCLCWNFTMGLFNELNFLRNLDDAQVTFKSLVDLLCVYNRKRQQNLRLITR